MHPEPPQSPTLAQKLTHIISSLPLLPSMYHPDIQSLSGLLSSPSQLSKHPIPIKLQTWYQLTQPALHSLQWEEPHEENKYPVAMVVGGRIEAARNGGMVGGDRGILGKLVGWVEAAGLRCVAVDVREGLEDKGDKAKGEEQKGKGDEEKGKKGDKEKKGNKKLEKVMRASHCAVIGELGGGQEVVAFMNKFLQLVAKMGDYPVMFLGSSALIAIQIMGNCTLNWQRKTDNPSLSQLHIIHSSKLFKSVPLPLRLHLQSRKKHPTPPHKLGSPIPQLPPSLLITGTQPHKSQTLILTIQHEKQQKYFIIGDPCHVDTPECIELWHCAINNFGDLARVTNREIDQKAVQGILVANYQVGVRGDHIYYLMG